MKSFDTDLKKYAEKMSLKASERRELRERVLSYMEYHPLPKQTVAQSERTREMMQSEPFIVFHFNALYARIAGGMFVVLLIMAPFVAERSVPGDPLYLIKTGFNETIQGQLANSPYKKIEFETKLMERRISEARVLASEGKLTQDVKTQIAENVKEHTDAVKDGLAELRTQDAEGAAIAEIAFNSSLEVQSMVLGANDSTNSTSSIDSILTVVNEAREGVASNKENSNPSFEGLMARVELETTRAYELFVSIKDSTTPEESIDIERRLSDIDRLIGEAKEHYDTEIDGAVDDLIKTLGLTQKLIAFMTDINVRQTVTLESLVPVVLSDQERIDIVKTGIEAISGTKADVEERLTTVEDAGVKAKVEDGVAQVAMLLIRATTALETADIVAAEVAIKEANAIITDLDLLTKPVEVTVPDETFVPEEQNEETGTTTATTTATIPEEEVE